MFQNICVSTCENGPYAGNLGPDQTAPMRSLIRALVARLQNRSITLISLCNLKPYISL